MLQLVYWQVQSYLSRPQCNVELTIRKYLIGGYRIQNRLSYGNELALLASVILAGSSIPRAMRSQKPLPTGLSVLATYGLYTFGKAWQAQK